MELIFLYINHSKSGFIDKQGINLNSQYYFEVIYEEEKYILFQKKKTEVKHSGFFDDSDCISNVTAIVGENGSGKTTLLNQLMISYGGVKENIVGREIFNFNRYEDAKRIAIYIDNGDIKIFHNIEGLVMSKELKNKEHYLYKNSKELSSILKENSEFANISRFLITNTYLGQNVNTISIHENVSDFYMNLSTWHTMKGDFWGQEYIRSSGFNGQVLSFSNLLMNGKSDQIVQQFIDCIYLNDIISRLEHTPFDKCLKRNLKISLFSFSDYINNNFYSEDDAIFLWHKKLQELIEILEIQDIYQKTLSVFYINLLEFMFQTRIEVVWSETKIDTLDKLRNIVKNNINKIKNLKLKTYFLEALTEIQKYINILLLSKRYDGEEFDYLRHNLKRTDIILEYGTNQYKKFLEAICESIFSNGKSFVIKCIDIKGIELSSGERALLNLFSWLNFLPKYKKIRYGGLGGLHDNVLVLIDELDLYCHPAWQQKLIYYLLNELKLQFKGKNVQLIFTTHSPIVLSDIPKDNTIYLKQSENRKMLIDKPENHCETFGANIYKLFNDAFFLDKSGQVGEFAKIKIMGIINKLWNDKENEKREIENDEFDKLKYQIQKIGDNILREKLLDMLFESRYSEFDYNTRKIKLYREKLRELGENDI